MIVLLFAFVFVTGIVSRIHQLVYSTSSSSNGGTIYNNYHYHTKSSTTSSNETAQAYSLWGKLMSGSNNEELQLDLASTDSFGFFSTITNTEWKQIQQNTKTSIELQFGVMHQTTELLLNNGGDNSVNNSNNSTIMWWKENWNVNFNACSDNIVNIGGMYTCDPLRIQSIANEKKKHDNEMKQRGWKKQQQSSPCIIYVSGGNNYNQFGEQLFHYLHDTAQQEVESDYVPCEIHLFTISNDDQSSIYNEAHDGVFIHPWGFHPSSSSSSSSNNNNNKMDNAFKTLQETIAELNHSGRISLLALDCEGCEWEIYKDILSLSSSSSLGGGGGGEPIIQQIVMQMHGAPNMANELFLAMQEAGYVIYNCVDVGDGHVWDYSWIQLSPSFFNWTQ
jgi:hypothetical protein